ncbi:MAG: hypothetical protein WCC06_11940 [Candidatus Aminicenantales bacterium]
MKMRIGRKRHERGAILIVSILTVLMMVLLALPFVFKLSSHYRSSERSYKSLAALNLAEAGAEMAIWEFNYGDISSWSGDSDLRTKTISSVQASGGQDVGDISIQVADPEGNSPKIESTGIVSFSVSQPLSKSVQVVLEKQGGSAPLFDCGVFAEQRVVLNAEAVVTGKVATNGTSNVPGEQAIVLNNGAQIDGDAMCGTGGDPSTSIVLNGSASISGTKDALGEPKELHSITVPAGLPVMGAGLSVDGGTTILTESNSGQYPFFSVSGSGTVIVSGDVVIYAESLSLGRDTTLQVLDGCRLTVYINSSMTLDNRCSINNASEDATRLIFYGTDNLTGDITFACRTTFYGAIYMPKASVTLSRDFDFYGALYAREVYLSRNVQVTYDEGLQGLSGGGGGGSGSTTYMVKSWQEKF